MERADGPLITHDEHEEFLRRLRERKMRLGIHVPKIEVRFKELCVEAKVQVGRRVLPTLVNATINTAQELMSLLKVFPTKERPIKILSDLNGIIKPSRMTLVLGPRGSGKSTFLRALSGKLDSNLKATGRVTHNGQDLACGVCQRMCAYVSQHDLHHAEMTVRETLDFSGRVLRACDTSEMSGEAMRREKAAGAKPDPEIDAFTTSCAEEEERNFVTDYILKILDLYDCADIIIGDEMRRGISGGEKKRVTIGEMLVGLAKCFFMDDISTGLDSSTTFEIIKFLKQMTHLMDLTMVISLLQPPSETYELFDDIILLCEGWIVYQGPRENVAEFFESMGFKCPKRKNMADFLQEVTSKMDQAQYWLGNQSTYNYIPVQKFAEYFHSFSIGRLLEDELHKPNHQSGDSPLIRLNEKYDISNKELFKACFLREMLLMKRNSLVHIFKIIQIALLAFVTMTVFLRTEMNHHSIADGYRFMGAIFVGVVIVKFNGMTELAMTIRRLPIYYKQKELLFLPGWALLSSIFILSVPVSFLETGIWTCLTYYVIGFAPSAIRFLQQFLAFFCVHQMSMSLYRFIAIVGRTQLLANTLGTATLVAVYILGGFVISKDNIQPWLVWGYWVSPMTYAQNAVAINEYLDERWSMEIKYGDNQVTVGKAILGSRGMFTESHWFWNCVGTLLGFAMLFNVSSILALKYLRAPLACQANIYIRAKDVKKTAKTGTHTTEGASHCGMILPFQPQTIAFSHINYYVDMPTRMKKLGYNDKRLQLLRDVSGAFRPGILTALMGVTGAGKTTLLDVLAGRKTGGYIEGSVSISGYPKKQETFARICGYCEQTDDNHSPFVTVYESLQYSAWLRLPSNVEMHTRNMFVDEVMDLVELRPLKNAMVGIPRTSGLSAEQRKRLTVAVELVSNPSIIFMDEPTTSLDARAAAIVMRTVRKTVDTGRTIVCTIHQPSIEIFEAFDELLLMKRGGQLIYGGPLGPLSSNMVQYFEAIPRVPKVRNGQNPAVWMLDVSSTAMEFKLGIDFAATFCNSPLYKENMQLVDELSKARPSSGDLHFASRYAQSFKTQCIACLWKQNRSYWKNPQHNNVRFIITIATTLLFGTVFMDIGSKITQEQDIFNILGAMYGSAMFLAFANASILQPVVGMERTVFYRERSAGMYSTMPYAIAQVTIEIPYIIIQLLIFSLIVYPMIGFQFALVKFFWFIFFIFLSFIYFALFGMMTVALTPNQEIAALLSFLIFLLWNIFSGFFIPRKMIPVWWRWYYWADPAAWTVYGLMVSQLGDKVDLIHVAGRSDQTVKEFLRDYLGQQDSHLALIVTLHIGIIILFLFVFGFSIKYFNFQRR